MDKTNILKKKVLLRAPVLSHSGYGVHSRQIARWLLSKDDVDLTVHPVQWGITPWQLDVNAYDGLIGQLMSKSKVDSNDFDVSFQVQLPNEWSRLAKKNIGITAGVETTICNPDWVSAVNAMDKVIVPTTFIKNVFEKSGNLKKDKVFVVPESYTGSVVQVENSLNIEFSTKFNFLLLGQLTSGHSESDRKNIFNTIKWFCEAFSNDPDVGLVIKTNNGRETKIDRKVTTDMIKNVIASCRKTEFPKIHLLHGAMTDEEIVGLYKHPTIKCLLTLTRGEGFGLPILEAAACGLPVMATGWSGHLDFMNLGKFIKIDFELKQIPKNRVDNKIFMPEAKWADVNQDDVKRKLIKFRDKSATPLQWAKELQKTIINEYSFTSIKEKYENIWDQLMK